MPLPTPTPFAGLMFEASRSLWSRALFMALVCVGYGSTAIRHRAEVAQRADVAIWRRVRIAAPSAQPKMATSTPHRRLLAMTRWAAVGEKINPADVQSREHRRHERTGD